MAANSEYRHPEAIKAALEIGLAKPGIPDFDKPAGARCPHQRHNKGCAVHGHHPFGCQIWSCRWLVDPETNALRRPDRAGYCIDIMPDFVTLDPGGDYPPQKVEVVVIWIDSKRPDAWREDVALRDYLICRAKEGKAAMLRLNASEAITVFPPPLCSDGGWHEVTRGSSRPQPGPEELMEGLAECRKIVLEVPP